MLEIFRTFINTHYKGKTGQRQVEAALELWEKHTRQKPYQVGISDVDSFVDEKLNAPERKDRLRPRALSLYLLYIAKFYEWLGDSKPESEKYVKLAKYIKEKSREVKPKKNAEPSSVDHHDVMKMLMEFTELSGRLLIRLLVFTNIPIGCLNNLEKRHIKNNEREYEMKCRGKSISGVLYSDTPDIIREYIEKKKLENEDKFLDISERHFENLIPDYAGKVGIEKRVTPRDLRKFAENPDLRNWLIEDYEEAKKNAKKEST